MTVSRVNSGIQVLPLGIAFTCGMVGVLGLRDLAGVTAGRAFLAGMTIPVGYMVHSVATARKVELAALSQQFERVRPGRVQLSGDYDIARFAGQNFVCCYPTDGGFIALTSEDLTHLSAVLRKEKEPREKGSGDEIRNKIEAAITDLTPLQQGERKIYLGNRYVGVRQESGLLKRTILALKLEDAAEASTQSLTEMMAKALRSSA